MKVKVLNLGDAESWALVPVITQRIYNFMTKYEPETEPGYPAAQAMYSFANGGEYFMAALIDDDKTVVGHALLQVVSWANQQYLIVLQLEVDRPTTEFERGQLRRELYNLAELVQATEIRAMAVNDRVYERFMEAWLPEAEPIKAFRIKLPRKENEEWEAEKDTLQE